MPKAYLAGGGVTIALQAVLVGLKWANNRHLINRYFSRLNCEERNGVDAGFCQDFFVTFWKFHTYTHKVIPFEDEPGYSLFEMQSFSIDVACTTLSVFIPGSNCLKIFRDTKGAQTFKR